MPTVKVLIPTPLRKFTGEADTVTVEGDSIGAVLKALVAQYAGIEKPLVDDNGNPKRFVNLYVNGEDIRFLDNTATVLKDGDEVSIVPAIAGGATVGTEVYSLRFTREMFDRPLLQNVGKKFRVTLTLQRANLNEDGGFAEIALTGMPDEIGRAIADLQTTGVSVTGPISDIVTPNLKQYVPATVGRGT